MYEGRTVVFFEKIRKLKEPKRPELRDNDFIQKRLRATLESPNFVYEDLEKPGERRVYYREEYTMNSKTWYVKVVVSISENPLVVITAFRPDYVKERGKSNLVYGRDK